MYQELDAKVSYIKGSPIRETEQMPRKVITNPIDDDWNARIRDMWWYHSNDKIPFGVSPRMFELRSKLLSFGGNEVCLRPFDSDLNDILSRGQLWYSDRTVMRKGLDSACHSNSANYWHEYKNTTVICTGYALSEDGMWRQHTWLVQLGEKENVICETTEARVLYYGFALTEEESMNFWERENVY